MSKRRRHRTHKAEKTSRRRTPPRGKNGRFLKRDSKRRRTRR